jgi:SLOG cluster2/TIR domain
LLSQYSFVTTQCQPYFRIYLVWHPQSPSGQKLAEHIFKHICADPDHPLLRGLGIPIHFRSKSFSPEAEIPRPIVFDDCFSSATFVLIDDEMVIDENWQDYIESLFENVSQLVTHHHIFPIAVSKNAFNLSRKIEHTNFIRIQQVDNLTEQQDILLRKILHECCRQLKQIQSKEWSKAPPPIKLFLSHAKQDGIQITQEIREWLLADNTFDNFFDTKDIAPGYDFKGEIEAGIINSALLICQTDAYTTRYYCRWEILTAKKYQIPTLLINALDIGEERSFPYMGNMPTFRWKGIETIPGIITRILLEILRHQYFPGYVEALKMIGKIPSQAMIISYAPELLNQVQNWQGEKSETDDFLIYPDPPLGDDEMEVLESLNPNIKAWTPSQPIPKMIGEQGRGKLSGKVIGISISESPDLEKLGFSAVHQKRALIEISRHLLAQGASVAYGGDLRPDGFTLDLVEMVKAYNEQTTERAKKILNFLAWPLHLDVATEWLANRKNEVSIQMISLPQDLKQKPFNIDENTFLKPNSTVNCYIWSRCLTSMREHMADKVDARIILGGRVTGYKGALPGIMEEAALAIAQHKPLFVLGAFGGCAKAVGEALLGDNPELLTRSYQISQNPGYEEMLNFYNQNSIQGSPHPVIDYSSLMEVFSNAGFGGLNNGLTELENHRLFEVEDLDEMVYLILKGLQVI